MFTAAHANRGLCYSTKPEGWFGAPSSGVVQALPYQCIVTHVRYSTVLTLESLQKLQLHIYCNLWWRRTASCKNTKIDNCSKMYQSVSYLIELGFHCVLPLLSATENFYEFWNFRKVFFFQNCNLLANFAQMYKNRAFLAMLSAITSRLLRVAILNAIPPHCLYRQFS